MGIRQGERLRTSGSGNDTRHRVKGARSGKGYVTSDRPKGAGHVAAEVDMIGARMNAKDRRKARRAAAAQERVRNGGAPRWIHRNHAQLDQGADFRQVDYAEIVNEDLEPGEVRKLAYPMAQMIASHDD